MEKLLDEIKNDFNLNDPDEENFDTLIDDHENLQENNVNTYFKLPIYYNEDKKLLDKVLINDLELKDSSDNKSIYKNIFKNNTNYTKYENQIIDQWTDYYTTDKNFIKDNQKIIKNFLDTSEYNNETNNKLTKNVYNSWINLKNLKYFNEKYQFMSWSIFEPLNNSSFFLTLLSYYNLSSPVYSLLFPILMLIIPFFILRFQGKNITLTHYWSILKVILSGNSFVQLFTNFSGSNLQNKIYMVISCIFYMIQIYQNIQCCIMFYENLRNIIIFYENSKKYILFTKKRMESLMLNNLDSLTHFNNNLKSKYNILCNIYDNINRIIKPQSFIFQLNQIGYIMKTYYNLYHNTEYHESIMYSFGFNSYYNNLLQINNKISSKKINYCKFVSDKHNSSIKNNYYINMIDEKPIKNNISIKKNIMITGPNASGKTTILKSFLINQILSQQIGCGCYDSADIKCYDHIYSYLNIPDTSGRDSLFQAEARRCKNIIDNIRNNETDSHLCIFDELYSGTNPSDAVETAYSFIKYLIKYKNNVRFLITTHYFDLCEKCDKKIKKNIYQQSMKTDNINGIINYTYLVQNGINKTRAGKDVLRQMEYPDEITE